MTKKDSSQNTSSPEDRHVLDSKMIISKTVGMGGQTLH